MKNIGRKLKTLIAVLSAVCMMFLVTGCDEIFSDQQLKEMAGDLLGDVVDSVIEDAANELVGEDSSQSSTQTAIEYGQTYTTAEDVALYLHTYKELPSNFITKKEAQALGWPGGSLEEYAPGKCIGGDHFGNYDELLPEKKGRTYKECDIDTLGAQKRGAKRLVWSNDGLIYYTDDHYETFTLLYGEE